MLVKLVADPRQKVRDRAFEMLVLQATPESFAALIKLDLATITPAVRKWESKWVEDIGAYPKQAATAALTRDSLLAAFKAFIADDPKPLRATQEGADGKGDRVWNQRVAALLEKDDLPLLRQVRRKRITYMSDEALDEYPAYSGILLSFTCTPEFVAWTKQLAK